MRKLLATFAGLAALAFAPGAAAAPFAFSEGAGLVVDDVDGDVLSLSSVVDFNIQNLENGDGGVFNALGSFMNNLSIDAIGAATVMQFEPTNLASIANLTMRFYDGDGYEETVYVTDADGEPASALDGFDIIFSLNLSEAANSEIWVEIMGDAMTAELSDLRPGFQVQISAIPLPGALPLLMAGLAGLGFAARRKKAS